MSLFTCKASNLKNVRVDKISRLIAGVMLVLLFNTYNSQGQILWSSAGGSAWLTNTNWTGNVVPTATDIAQFGANPTASTGVGINFGNTTNAGTQTNGQRIEDVAAIEITSARAAAHIVGNSSATAGATGTLRLLGATVNTVANTVLRNNSSQTFTIQNTQGSGSQTMGVALGNATDNIVTIDGTGGIVISSIISGSNKLTKSGSGTGVFQLTGANTYTGLTTVSGGTLQLNRSGGTTIPNTNSVTVASGGTLLISTTQTLNNVTVNSGGTLIIAAGLTVSGTFTMNGTLQINSGGFTNTAPAYGSTSTLKYNSTGTYGRGTEWSATSGNGYPANVQVSNNTTLNLGNGGTGTARQCSGNITIDAGSTLSMNVATFVMTAALTALGDMNLAGTLVLSSSGGGDIKIGGNWNFTAGGTFTSNSRAVFFTGGAQQTITRSAAGTLNFDYLLNQNTSGGLKLATGTSINVNGSGDGLQLAGTGTGNSLDLNGNTLQLGTGTNIQLTGSQTITSSAGTGILKVQTGGNNNVNSGTALTTSSSVDVQLNGGMDFGSSLTTINGTLIINSGGFVTGNAPSYGSGSTLKYNSGSTYGRGIEWGSASGPAYPYNVQASNNTTVSPGANSRQGVTLNTANDVTIDAGSAIYMDFGGNNMTVPLIINGSLILNGSLSGSGASGGDIKVRGNWTSTGSFFPNSRAVFFDGASGTQTITKAGGQSFDFLIVDKAAGGVTLANDITVSQAATLTNGIITTGSNKVIISSGGTVSRTNGHVAGFLQKAVGTGSPSITYEIGGASNYRPVTVAFNNVTSGGNLTASVSQAAGAHPNLATSNINNTLRLDRYFTLTNSGTAFTSYDATFNYVAGDVINGANPLNFIAGKWNGSSWSYPTVGTKTSTSTQITGETSFSDFAFGELNATPTLNAGTLADFGSICINTTGGPNTFTITGSALTTANVTVASLNGFSYSTDNTTYTSSLSISQPGGTFSQLIYVKFSPTLGQSYNGNIVVGGGGASNINVAATGTGLNTPPTVTTAAATGVTAIAATIPGSITSTGCSAVSAYGVEYSTSNGFANGTGTQAPGSNLSGSNFSVGISGLSPATTYYYHAYATNGGGTGYSTQGSFTTVTPTLSGSALTGFGNVCTGLTAGPNTFTITGTNLSAANVTVASLNGFSYSTDDITYTASLSIPQPGGSFSQLVYVKFSPTLVQSYNGNIVLGGGGAANFNEAATGSGVSTAPSLTTGGSSGVTQVAATLNGTITANGCTSVTAYGIEYSTTNGFVNGSGTQAPGSNLSGGNFSVAISGLLANTTYYYKAYATNAGGTGYGSQQSFTTTGLNAPVATAATNIASTSFTANWNTVTGATSYGLDVSTSNTFSGPGVVATEAFENPLTLFTATGTGAFYTGSSLSTERPPSSPYFSAGASGYGVTNGTAVLTSGNINTTGGTASVSFKLASFSLNGTGNGADGGDIVTVEVSPNGGTSYFSTLRVLGNSNACWAFSATGSASTAYDGNATPVDFAASGGGLLAAGTSTITISNLPSATNVRIRITLLNDNANERWVIDDLNVNGTAGLFVPGYNNLSVAGTSQSVTGLTANTTYYYRVRGVSANSTSTNSNTITALTCQTANLSSTHNNVTCNGGTNGSIDLTVTGGTLPYGYSWTGPGGFTATTEDISSLAAGTYTITVTSNTGCPATTTVTVTEPAALSATLSGTPTICAGASGNITVTISGGTAPYSVTYNDGVGNTTVGSLSLGANNIPVSPAGTTSYSLVSVTDNASCTGSVSGSATVTVNPNYTVTASAGAHGTISPNGVTTLSCDGTGDQAYTITPDACYSIADVLVDGSSVGAVGTYTFTDVTANHTISATFVLNTYTITVTAGANGSVTPATGSVNCGSNATYTITPNACYAIADVVVDGVSQGAVGTYTFTNVTANHTISATFVLNTYTITVTAGANGSITPATGSVNCGANATYTITPNACYAIADVVVDGVSQGAVGTYTFTNVTANHTISATFALNTYTITVTAGANGSITPATGSVNCGANATYTITPNACYSIADVVVDGVSQGAVGTYTFTNVTANHTISATFVLNTYTITVTAGANGSVTPATGSVNCGDNATYTITPNACYSIADVVVDGVSQGAVGTYTFTNVTANHTISATFVLNTYTITVTAGANGSVTPATGSVNCGDNATYTITPNACYSIADVVVDGVSQGAVGTYTFTNVTANHTISATFVLNTYTITVTAGANGSITPATGSVNCGANATYTITPNACYSIADVVVDGVSQGAVGTYTFTNVTANHTISATFVLNTYTITVTAGANGSITPATGSVNCGDNATYTITPNACYSIADVVVDGVSQGAVGTYTFTNVTANHTISATFVLTNYTITVTAGANGSITPATGSVNCGANATYTITPNACYTIADVVVDGSSVGAVGSYTFTNVTANHTISATFVLTNYTITVTAGANGSITPATGSVNCGDNATYTITPNACYAIADVVVDGVSQGAVGSYTFTNVTANHTISATFVLNTYTITVTAGANGSITPATGSVNCGANATYTITPNACYAIADVLVDGSSVGAVGSYTFTNVTANHTISATFVATTYTITVTAGANGSITPATGSVNCGDNATYTITPNACYSIADVVVDGVSQGAVGTYTFTNVTANHTISATFVLNTYTITVTAGANGSITPGTGSVNCGSNATYTISPVACYHVQDVLVDGSSVGAVTSYTFTNVTANHTISATFAINTALTAPVVTGPINVCNYIGTGDQVVYTASSAGATGYSWITPPNVTVVSGAGTSTLTVTFQNGFVAQANKQIRVTALSACGNSPQTIYYLTAQILSTPSPIIASNSNVCGVIGTAGTITYKIPAVLGATSYVWTAQAGTTTINHPNGAGANDTLVTVSFTNSFTSSSITVSAVNGCGTSSARSLAITKSNPSTPGLISGSTNVCENILPGGTPGTYKIMSVANATSYTWSVTPGTAVVNHPNGPGAMDTVITVLFQSGFTSGSITVSASNGCGTSGLRTLSLTKLNPATPSVMDVIQLQPCPDRQYSYTLASVPANATSIVWTIPVGATLVSQSPAGPLPTSITVSYPSSGINGNVTAQALNNCGSSVVRTTVVKLPGCPEARNTYAKGGTTVTTPAVEAMQVKLYPNPTVNEFTLQVNTAAKQVITVRIMDLQGRELKRFTTAAYQATNLGAELKAGTYMIEVRQGNEVKTTKLIKF